LVSRRADELLRAEWLDVTERYAADPNVCFIDRSDLKEIITDAINHDLVTYRFCLPTQIPGKLRNPHFDCLKLHRGKAGDATAWDARSLASKVVAPFNAEQESVLGRSPDPYVSKPLRQPKMFRDDSSKKDIPGWNALIHLLEVIEGADDGGRIV
jgi:hypothetical protein